MAGYNERWFLTHVRPLDLEGWCLAHLCGHPRTQDFSHPEIHLHPHLLSIFSLHLRDKKKQGLPVNMEAAQVVAGKKLGKFLGKGNGETETGKLNKAEQYGQLAASL